MVCVCVMVCSVMVCMCACVMVHMLTTHEVKKVDPGEVRRILVAHSQQLDPRECQVMPERKSTHYVKFH